MVARAYNYPEAEAGRSCELEDSLVYVSCSRSAMATLMRPSL